MEHAAFESPLSDEQLKELGRLAVNFGFVEFLTEIHVCMLFEIKPSARVELISPLAMRRKLEILTKGIHTIHKQETRTLVDEACKLLDSAVGDRKILLHGIWGVDGAKPEGKAVVVPSGETIGHRRPADITKHADALAIASRKLKQAMTGDSGGKHVDEAEPLVINLA